MMCRVSILLMNNNDPKMDWRGFAGMEIGGGGGGVGGSVDLTHLPPLIDRSFFPTFFGKEFDYPFQMLIIVIKHTIWLATNFPDL